MMIDPVGIHREAFEERVYSLYFISKVTRSLMLERDVLTKAQFLARNDRDQYERDDVQQAYMGWLAGIEYMNGLHNVGGMK